jgi:hypothetical protein
MPIIKGVEEVVPVGFETSDTVIASLVDNRREVAVGKVIVLDPDPNANVGEPAPVVVRGLAIVAVPDPSTHVLVASIMLPEASTLTQ